MAGIAGILKEGKQELVSKMIETISHRGNYGKTILEKEGATIGMVWSKHEEPRLTEKLRKDIFCDGPGFGQMVQISRMNGNWEIFRDELGVSPMYSAENQEGDLCFASEIKAIADVSTRIYEVLPGHITTQTLRKKYFHLDARPSFPESPEVIARELFNLLSLSVTSRINSGNMGSWLSGGLDSSAIAVLARPWLTTFHTFAAGVQGAPDLNYARFMSSHLGSIHHEIIVDLLEMLRVLPLVIYHLESFDALLVRSSIINYLVAKEASEYVEEVFSGEGGDEFFAGYEYLKQIPEAELDRELVDISSRLHNTALQRVDRCASAHGLTAHVVFADPHFFEFALRIPILYKLMDGIEKWILRKAMEDVLPKEITWRPKAKFWEGAGVGELISKYASVKVTDNDFMSERHLKNDWILNTKEELFYYRIFKDHFGQLENLDWMGRTKGSPKSN